MRIIETFCVLYVHIKKSHDVVYLCKTGVNPIQKKNQSFLDFCSHNIQQMALNKLLKLTKSHTKVRGILFAPFSGNVLNYVVKSCHKTVKTTKTECMSQLFRYNSCQDVCNNKHDFFSYISHCWARSSTSLVLNSVRPREVFELMSCCCSIRLRNSCLAHPLSHLCSFVCFWEQRSRDKIVFYVFLLCR